MLVFLAPFVLRLLLLRRFVYRLHTREGEAAKIDSDGGLSRHCNMGAEVTASREEEGRFVGASAVVFDGLVDRASMEAHGCNEALALPGTSISHT